MTEQEAIDKMKQLCKKEARGTGWLGIFNTKDLLFEKTRILEDWEKTANFKLPENIHTGSVFIDNKGIKYGKTFYNWSDIVATGIIIQTLPSNDEWRPPKYLNFILIGFKNGNIIEYQLGDIQQYYGLFGHFIEQYKIEHKKSASSN